MSHLYKSVSMAVMALLVLGACAVEQNSFIKQLEKTGKWSMNAEEKAKYAKYDTNTARSKFVRDRFLNETGVMQTETERKELAAAIYMNFAMLQARAIPAYCKGMNVDISSYQSAFAQGHRREEAGLTKVLAAHGTTADAVWENYAKRMRTTAKYELMSAGSSYNACKIVQKDPQKLANMTKFSTFYPDISRLLSQ